MIKLFKGILVFILAACSSVCGAAGDAENHFAITIRDQRGDGELIAALKREGLREVIIGPAEFTKDVEQHPGLKSLKIEIENEDLYKRVALFICPKNCPDLIHLSVMHLSLFGGLFGGYEKAHNDVIFLDVSHFCKDRFTQRYLFEVIPILFPELRSLVMGGVKFYNDPDMKDFLMQKMAAFFKGAPHLRSLSLDFVNDEVALLLQQLTKLETLVIKNAHTFSGAGLSALSQGCKRLKHLDLSSRPFLALDLSEQDLEAFLKDVPQLEFLDVTGREVDAMGREILSKAFFKRISAEYPSLVIYCK